MNKALIILLSIALFLASCGNNRKDVKIDTLSPKLISDTLTKEATKPITNVYVENSGSMFGYISSGNDFDRSLSSLLTMIKIKEYSDTIQLHYINSKVFIQNESITSFIRNITLHNAQTWQGSLAETNMCALFDTVISKVNNNNISIFVSDCIFSPGQEDAKRFIGAQKDCISIIVNNKLKNHNLAFTVLRLISNFHGSYFDCQDNPTMIEGERPYYIWIIGTKNNISAFKQIIELEDIEGQLQNTYTIFKSEINTSYSVQLNPKIGKFDRTNPTTIMEPIKDRDSDKFMFSIGVDFSSLLLDDSYLTNPENYNISDPNYKIEIDKWQMASHTHLIKVTTTANIISPTELTIQLKNHIPDWVDEFSDESCDDINSDEMMQKTFGLKSIIHGIYSGYNFQDDLLSEINININQNN